MKYFIINPYIKDWYMEGLATLFAEEYCSSKNLLPKNWKKSYIIMKIKAI